MQPLARMGRGVCASIAHKSAPCGWPGCSLPANGSADSQPFCRAGVDLFHDARDASRRGRCNPRNFRTFGNFFNGVTARYARVFMRCQAMRTAEP